MSSPWTDEELLHELAAALREEPVDDSIIRAAQGAFAWRTVDADLILLELDSSATAAAGAPVRAGGSAAARTLAFHGERLSVEIEIDEAGIVGQLTPPQPGRVTLLTAAGPGLSTQADEVGCFAFPSPASGPIRLDCRVDDDHFVTQWVTV
jgi:hypothetical protein